MRSPKDKFMGRVLFKKPVKGIGSVVMFTAETIDQLVSYASQYNAHEYTLKVSENRLTYPDFDWVDVKVILNHPGRGGARAGAGRPSLYSCKKRAQVMLTEENINKIDDYAKKEGMSKSDSINYILDSFFSSHE